MPTNVLAARSGSAVWALYTLTNPHIRILRARVPEVKVPGNWLHLCSTELAFDFLICVRILDMFMQRLLVDEMFAAIFFLARELLLCEHWRSWKQSTAEPGRELGGACDLS